MSHMTVGDLQHRPEHAKSPWVVRWRVDGRGRTKSFARKDAANKYRARLLVAEGERFDPATGEPASWARTASGTWASFASAYVRRRWTHWSAGQRKSAVESLMMASLVLVQPRARQRPEEARLRAYLRDVVLLPADRGGEPDEALETWLERWSLPMEDLTTERAEEVLEAYSTKLDGGTTAPTTLARRRAVFYGALKAAVNRRLLEENPLDRSEWRPVGTDLAVDPKRVPSVAQVRALLDELRQLSATSPRMVAYGALLGLAGLRPSEATALRVSDLTLPETGWGVARLANSMTKTGSRYGDQEQGLSERGLKKRQRKATRSVPLAPEVVAHLRRHLALYPSSDGYVFANASGNRLSSANFSDVFGRTVARLHPDGPLSSMTPYTLRRAAASMMLRAGVTAPDVAERLGHETDVLLRVYANVVDQEREQANARIEAALG